MMNIEATTTYTRKEIIIESLIRRCALTNENALSPCILMSLRHWHNYANKWTRMLPFAHSRSLSNQKFSINYVIFCPIQFSVQFNSFSTLTSSKPFLSLCFRSLRASFLLLLKSPIWSANTIRWLSQRTWKSEKKVETMKKKIVH